MAYSEERFQKAFYPQPKLDSAFTRGRFHGKVAIVTGGTSGIGRAVVERFCNDGATVAMFARGADRGHAVERTLRQTGMAVTFYQVDVADKDRCVEAVQQVAKDNGGSIHFLVNSHGLRHEKSHITDVTIEHMKEVIDANFVGTVSMIQACYPYMKDDGENCAIVNVSSMRAYNAVYSQAPWCSMKAAINMLSKCAALDFSRVGIRVNSVSPGYVWTASLLRIYGSVEQSRKARAATCHTTRDVIQPAGVASVVTFLCSQDARYIDGADVPVDCGNNVMGPEGLGH